MTALVLLSGWRLRVNSTSSQLARAAVQRVWRTAIQPVSGLRRTAHVWPDSRSTSCIGGSGHRLAKSQRLHQPEAVVRRCTMGVCSWPKGACQGVTSVARDDHLLGQSLIDAVGALICRSTGSEHLVQMVDVAGTSISTGPAEPRCSTAMSLNRCRKCAQ